MTLKNTKVILFVSLIVAIILPFGMMDDAVAEETLSEKQIQRLLERTYNLSVQIENVELLAENGKEASKRYKQLQKVFDDNVSILNGYGYITTEQLDDDPSKYDKTIQERSGSLDDEGIVISSNCACQILFVDSGFYKNTWWIFWDWVYSEQTLGELNFVFDSDTMETTLGQDYNKIKLGTRTQLQTAGSATYTYNYSFSGSHSSSESGARNTTATSNPEIIVFAQLDNAKSGDKISIDYTALTLSP